MKTDDRATRQRNEAEGDEAKVVRLSDWLAPDDELVPFGPRARTASRAPDEQPIDSHAEPPAAAGFWDGDTSVHTAVPGPEMFDQPDERAAERSRNRWRPAPAWRSALPPLPRLGRDRAHDVIAALIDRISWPWAAGGLAFLMVVVVGLLTLLSGPSAHRDRAAQATIGDQPRALTATFGEIGSAARPAAVADLRALPPVNTDGRTIGAAAVRAQALQAHHRRHAVVASASAPQSTPSTTGSVNTTTTPPPTDTPPAATDTTPAPTATEPVQSTPTPAPASGGGGRSSDSGSSGGSHKQPTFGAAGSLGPGSSPDG